MLPYYLSIFVLTSRYSSLLTTILHHSLIFSSWFHINSRYCLAFSYNHVSSNLPLMPLELRYLFIFFFFFIFLHSFLLIFLFILELIFFSLTLLLYYILSLFNSVQVDVFVSNICIRVDIKICKEEFSSFFFLFFNHLSSIYN